MARALSDGALLHPIDLNEYGEPMSEGQYICDDNEVWTNTKTDGTPVSVNDCGGWGAGNYAGMSSSAGRWTVSAGRSEPRESRSRAGGLGVLA